MESAWLYACHASGLRAVPLPASTGEDPLEAAYAVVPHGVYEGLRTHDGCRLFGLEAHLARARTGGTQQGLATWDEAVLRAGLAEAFERHEGDLRVRIDFLAGPATALGTDARILIGLRPLRLPPPEAYRDGVGVQLVRDLAREEPEIKGAAFATRRRAHAFDPRDNHEPILTAPDGALLEGIMSNLFGFLPSGLRTAGGGVLPGITRGAVIELARGRGWPVEERPIAEAEVAQLEEACLTSSVRGVLPIVRIADRPVGNGSPGPRTRELQAALAERIRVEARPPLED